MDGNIAGRGPWAPPTPHLGEADEEQPLIRLVEGCLAPCRFSFLVGDSRDLSRHGAGLPPHLASAPPSRQASYTAGRWAAAGALERLGLPAVQPGYCPQTQLPVWPPGGMGSVTHTRRPACGTAPEELILAGALVWRPDDALDSEGRYLTFGLDAERIMSSDRARRLATRLGVALATGLPDGIDGGTRATLVFSLKEAAFKAVSLSTGLSCGLGELVIVQGQGGGTPLVEGEHRRPSGVALSGTVALEFAGSKAPLNAWAEVRAWYWLQGDVVWTAAAIAKRTPALID